MSAKERDRLDVMARVKRKELTVVEASPRHPLAQATFLDEGFLQVPELAVEQVGAHADQADDHVGGDRRIGALDPLAEGGIGGVWDPVQLTEAERVGMTP